jgi:glycosyltransferase involved in cell wall biosynthesis
MKIFALDLGPSWRGGQRQTLLLVSGLARRGHEILLAARERSPLHERAAASGVRVEPMPGGAESAPGILFRLARAARRFAPDVVYAGDARGHGAAVWSRIASQRPLVVHRRVIFPPGRDPLSRLKYRAADRFLAVSKAVAASLAAAGVPETKVEVVPDGLPPEAYVAHSPLPAPPFRLIHVGAFDGRKGQEIVVEVLARLVARERDATALFLGDGPRRAKVEAAARRAGVDARCTFPGDVDDVARRLAESHLLLLPSESEGAPLALVEAMAAGCAVLAHDVGGAAEICASGAGRLVRSLDLAAWEEAVLHLLDNPVDREKLVAAGRTAAAERTLARTLDRVEAALESA